MKTPTVLLGEVCRINPPTPPDKLKDKDVCSFVPMDAVNEVSAQISRTVLKPVSTVTKGYTPFIENDVLLAKITPCMENGKCAIAKRLHGGIGFGSTEFHVLRASKHILPEWMFYFWRLPATRLYAARRMTGSAGQRRVSTEFLETLEIPLPDLAKQRQIAAALEQADRLRRTRRYALELASGFLYAIFRQRFREHFEVGPSDSFGSLVTITGGGTPAREHPEYFQGRIPWLTSKDMRGEYIWDTEEHITEEAIRKSSTKLIPAGSILIVVKSKILMHRLPVAITKVSMCHGQDIKSVQCSEKLHPEFARFLLKFHERRLLQVARGANTEGLNLPMLEELPVPRVSFEEQQRFAALVARHERLRARHREALRQADHLFQTLLHRAFAA